MTPVTPRLNPPVVVAFGRGIVIGFEQAQRRGDDRRQLTVNELTAAIIQQVQALQTLEITRARAEVEADAQRQSQEEYARRLQAWLNRSGTTTLPRQGRAGYAVEPVPEHPLLRGATR